MMMMMMIMNNLDGHDERFLSGVSLHLKSSFSRYSHLKNDDDDDDDDDDNEQS